MSVNIHGKAYLTVAERLGLVHKEHPKCSITTELLSNINGVSVIKATVKFDDRVFTGHASEKEGSTMINKTSAMENAETSAIGRALASAGYAGSEFASADEVANALKQQAEPAKLPPITNAVSNIEQVSSAKPNDVIPGIMGLLQTAKERQTKTGKDVTDYLCTSMDGNHKTIISRWGKCHEGLKQGQVVVFKNVKVGTYQNKPTFTAQEMEVVGHTEMEADEMEADERDFQG